MVAKTNSTKRKKTGFTLIEVLLFLAITGAIFVAVAQTVFVSIHVQRYRDTTKDLSEFFRQAYSSVVSTENIRTDNADMTRFCTIASMWEGGSLKSDNNPISSGTSSQGQTSPGRSNCAVYGKLITWGEKVPGQDQREKTLRSYDIIGRVFNGGTTVTTSSGDVVSPVKEHNPLSYIFADVVSVRGTTLCEVSPAGNTSSYDLQWDGWVGTNKLDSATGEREVAAGALMIVRSPVSGTITTYSLVGQTLDIQAGLAEAKSVGSAMCTGDADLERFRSFSTKFLYAKLDSFTQDEDTYLCVESKDRTDQPIRALKINKMGNNASAVELADDAVSEEHCKYI